MYAIRSYYVLDRSGWIRSSEVVSLYENHEVAVHTVHHYHLERIPPDIAATEILDDRRALEALVGCPVRGMSFPFGTFSDDLVRLLPSLGIEYARTVRETHLLEVPADVHVWDPTCHHNHDLLALGERFLKEESSRITSYNVCYTKLLRLCPSGHVAPWG